MPSGFDWEAHPKELEQLKTMWEAGHSGSEIALAIGNGITKNSIIGRVTRMKLVRHRGVDKHRAPPKPVGDPFIKPSKPLPKPKEKPPAPECPESILEPEAFAGHGKCKWLYGDPVQKGWQMCGNTVIDNGPWCPYHKNKAIDPSGKKKL